MSRRIEKKICDLSRGSEKIEVNMEKSEYGKNREKNIRALVLIVKFQKFKAYRGTKSTKNIHNRPSPLLSRGVGNLHPGSHI